jgi:hypothetical protein
MTTFSFELQRLEFHFYAHMAMIMMSVCLILQVWQRERCRDVKRDRERETEKKESERDSLSYLNAVISWGARSGISMIIVISHFSRVTTHYALNK